MIRLAIREATVRGRTLAAAVLVVAAVAGLQSAMGLLARSGEAAASQRLDTIGPALTVLPKGRSLSAAQRLEAGAGSLPASLPAELAARFPDAIRVAEGRLVKRCALEGSSVPVIGVRGLHRGKGAVGAVLASRLNPDAGVQVCGVAFHRPEVRPVSGSAEDTAVFVPLEELQSGDQAINEIRIQLHPGHEPAQVARQISASLGESATAVPDAREEAEAQLRDTLGNTRWALHITGAAVVFVCLLVASYLDELKRRHELAILCAIGASPFELCVLIASRAAIVGVIGGVAGYLMGAAVALSQDFAGVISVSRGALAVGLGVMASAALAAVLGALPVAAIASRRDHARVLQEG